MSLALCASQSLQAKETKSPYMGGEASLTTMPNGAIINAEVLVTTQPDLG